MKPEENIWSSLGLLSLPMEGYLAYKYHSCRITDPLSKWCMWSLIQALQLPICIERSQPLPAHLSLTENNLTNIKERKKKDICNLLKTI